VSLRRSLAHGARLAVLLVIVAAHMLLERPAAGEKLTLGVSAVGAGQGGLFMAVEGRFFERQGLDVELLFVGSGTEATQALLSGRLAASLVGGPSPVNATLAGGELVWVAGLVNVLPYVLVVSPEVTTPAELKGKQLGVNRLGSAAELAARFMLARLGLNPQTDVTLLQAGEQAARLAALQARSIQATLLEPPGTVVARRLGFRELASLAPMKLYFPHEALATSRRFVREQPETLRKLVTGLVLGTHAFKTRRDEGIQALRKYLKVDDPEALAETYAMSAGLIESKPYMPIAVVQTVLDMLATSDPRARSARAEEFVDMRFVTELDRSGFIDRLYR
jgi:NitT/TauT family transport system substrate-binding protein